MKKVKYICDVCGGELICRKRSTWLTFNNLTIHSPFGANNVEFCNNCWDACKKWVRNHRFDRS